MCVQIQSIIYELAEQRYALAQAAAEAPLLPSHAHTQRATKAGSKKKKTVSPSVARKQLRKAAAQSKEDIRAELLGLSMCVCSFCSAKSLNLRVLLSKEDCVCVCLQGKMNAFVMTFFLQVRVFLHILMYVYIYVCVCVHVCV